MDIVELAPMEVQYSLAKEPGIEAYVAESTQNLWYFASLTIGIEELA
jgi:hypothetical protein